MSDTEKIAIDSDVYESIVTSVVRVIIHYDKYQKYKSEIQTMFDDMEDYTSSDIFGNYKKQIDRINDMLNDYYNLVMQAFKNFCDIGGALIDMDGMVYRALIG